MKKIVLWICTVVMTLIASACIAGAYSPYFEAEPPREVREHTANRWPDYELEDYCEALRWCIVKASGFSSAIIE